MYIVTFYSFKGGVGRTLALANIGLQLAKTGRRVLLVDFDLEAPGLDTFEMLCPREAHCGIIEYVSEFMTTRAAPDVRDFIYEVHGVAQRSGRLWIMPAGKGGPEYSKQLSRMNWLRLYEEFDGFFMFEDIKAQWLDSFRPDYILIDSRTGHTDTVGICTRQLPDAVVVLFFPNEQNLNGLKPTVSSIRKECENRTERKIQLHYVMSNVPDLDDEQEILSGLHQRFQTELRYEKLTSVIHRYDSLSLLKQSLFVVERPKSRLAKEYKGLLEVITQNNTEDRHAVLRKLKLGVSPSVFAKVWQPESQTKWVDDILKHHSRDGEILYLTAMDLKRRGSLERYEILLARSIELGYKSPEAFLAQAEVKMKEQDLVASTQHVWDAFSFKELSQDNLIQGIEILRRANPSKLETVSETNAFASLPAMECSWIADELMWSKEGLHGAINLLKKFEKDKKLTIEEKDLMHLSLSLALMGLGRFDEVMGLFGKKRPDPQVLRVEEAFNYGVAEWGKTGKHSEEMFIRVIELDAKERDRNGANYNQCLAISLWCLGRKKEALERLVKAKNQIDERPSPEFTCWRYMKVTPTGFREDCESIKMLIEGKDIRPEFFPD